MTADSTAPEPIEQICSEVLIKLSAGVLLMAFGTFWLGEGLGLLWPFGDVSLLGLMILYGLLCTLTIWWLWAR